MRSRMHVNSSFTRLISSAVLCGSAVMGVMSCCHAVASRSGANSSPSSPSPNPSGPGTAYNPMNHLPRSISRQRELQNGNDLWAETLAYSNSFEQYGQRAGFRGGWLLGMVVSN